MAYEEGIAILLVGTIYLFIRMYEVLRTSEDTIPNRLMRFFFFALGIFMLPLNLFVAQNFAFGASNQIYEIILIFFNISMWAVGISFAVLFIYAGFAIFIEVVNKGIRRMKK